MEPSLTNIAHTVVQTNTSNTREIRILNQGESFRFLVLVDKGEAAQLKIEVRGKGVTGHVERREKSSFPTILSLVVALVSVIVGIVSLIFGRAHSEKRIGEVLTSQRGY